jgi:2-oxo-3-hexenedioate decarboxylase
LVPIDGRRDWLKAMTDVEVTLFRNGIEVDRGKGVNALDGPISALSHFINGLDRVSLGRLKVGEIVTTGTLTQALRAYPRETWSTEIRGLPVEGMRLKFT